MSNDPGGGGVEHPLDPETAALVSAVELTPDNFNLRAVLGERLLSVGEFDRARGEARRVLESIPDNLTSLRVAAVASESLGELELAMSYWNLHDAVAGSDSAGGLHPPTASQDHGGTAVGADDRTTSQPRSSPDNADPEIVPAASSFLEFENVDSMSLDDVAGMDDVKRRLRSMFLAPLTNPKLREMYGSDLRGGLLLFGPPGCGKTYIARALAGELGTRFMHIGLPDVLDMWLGNSERNLHELFETARANAPMVLFLDELDVLGASRSAMRASPMHGVVAQLLVEMDGLKDNNDGLFVLGATNQPWNVDPAVRRPGRFDRMLFVGPPDVAARERILANHLTSRPVEPGLDLRWLAEHSADFSGADMAAVVTEAAQEALMESLDTGNARGITNADLRRALKGRRPSIGGWLDTAHNVVTFSDKSGEFSELADYLRKSRRR